MGCLSFDYNYFPLRMYIYWDIIDYYYQFLLFSFYLLLLLLLLFTPFVEHGCENIREDKAINGISVITTQTNYR